MSESEKIVFVDKNGKPTGEVGPKLESHNESTKLHLAFSCYIFQANDNKFLFTQRALSKKVWPCVWTNSLCGHPSPGETIEDAIRRRALFELGIQKLENIKCVLPNYIYVTPPYNGIIENEFCPVFVAYTSDKIEANTSEVEAYQWIDWLKYVEILRYNNYKMSYWAKDQFTKIRDREPFSLIKSGF
jgi:isopentenyl-diphosphate delta-isomerase